MKGRVKKLGKKVKKNFVPRKTVRREKLRDAEMDNKTITPDSPLIVSCGGGKYTFEITAKRVRPIFVVEDTYRFICPKLRMVYTSGTNHIQGGECLISGERCKLLQRYDQSYRKKKPSYCVGDWIKFPCYKAFALIEPKINDKKYELAFVNLEANIRPFNLKSVDNGWRAGVLRRVYERINNAVRERRYGDLTDRGIPKPGDSILFTSLMMKPDVEIYLIGPKDVDYPHLIRGVAEWHQQMTNGRVDLVVRGADENGNDGKWYVPITSTCLVIVRSLGEEPKTDIERLRRFYLKMLMDGHVAVFNANAGVIYDYCRNLGNTELQKVLRNRRVVPFNSNSEHDRDLSRLNKSAD